MAKAKDIVMAYQKALGKGDMAGARTYLHDDLSFVGPFESFQRPEPYLEALGKLHHIVERVEPRRTFVDGDDVCVLYDMVTNTPAGTAFIAEWYQVKDGKIAALRAVFDGRPFAPYSEGEVLRFCATTSSSLSSLRYTCRLMIGTMMRST